MTTGLAAVPSSEHGLTDEQRAFVEAIRDFAERETWTVPEGDHHSEQVAAKMAELGWYGLQIPEEYGGSGGSFLDAILFLEETTRGQIPIGGYGVTLIVTGALNRFGSEGRAVHPECIENRACDLTRFNRLGESRGAEIRIRNEQRDVNVVLIEAAVIRYLRCSQ